MMKFLAILGVFLLPPVDKPVHIKGRGYEGYSFGETYFILKGIDRENKRFTPTIADIAVAEQLLKQQLPGLNKSHINQVGSLPVIDKKLSKYARQYIGFLNSKGERVVWVNFVWDKDSQKKLSQDIISVSDGGSYFWNVEINISTQSVYNLDVNGLG